jgi:hypothetical protein
MNEFERMNSEELRILELEVRKVQELIETHQQTHQSIKAENA